MIPQLIVINPRISRCHQCLHLTQKRFRRYKLMRGHLPWNRWTPQSFRSAIYKYVTEDDYNNLRSKQGLIHTEQEAGSTGSNIDELYNTALSNPSTTHKKIPNVQQELYPQEFVPRYILKFFPNDKNKRIL